MEIIRFIGTHILSGGGICEIQLIRQQQTENTIHFTFKVFGIIVLEFCSKHKEKLNS